jgi:hypothetical protein
MNEQITQPAPSAEVTQFLGLWDDYHKAANACRLESLSTWGRDYAGIIANNQFKAEENSKAMIEVLQLGEAMLALGEGVALAATEYQSALYTYNEEIKAEADKPRREWEQAREAMVGLFEKEKRSLAIKLGKLGSKRYRGSEVERAYVDEQYELLVARQSVVELMLANIQWMRYSEHEGTVFSDELIAQTNEARAERINALIAKYDAKRLIEVDAE